jgi:hypothetical protein
MSIPLRTFAGVAAYVPPRDAWLTTEQVADWLQISAEQVRRLNLPAVAVGKRKWRYLAGQVLDALEKRAE